MVLTELCPESWMRATCAVSRCSNRCQGASAREGTNYRTAAQQTLTPPWGQPSISLPRPPTLDLRPGTIIANSSPSPSQGVWQQSLRGVVVVALPTLPNCQLRGPVYKTNLLPGIPRQISYCDFRQSLRQNLPASGVCVDLWSSVKTSRFA